MECAEYSLGPASLAFEDLHRLTRNVDLAIAPHYVFTHMWISVFGDSLTSLRLPSALAMAAAGGLVGLLGRREGPGPEDVFLHDAPQRRGDHEAGECPDPGRCAAGHQRIWLVAAGRGGDPFSGMEQRKSRVLREEFRTVRTANFANVRLLLLERQAYVGASTSAEDDH